MDRRQLSIWVVAGFVALGCAPPSEGPATTAAPVDPGLTCQSDGECPLDWVCLGGLCVEFECETKETCPAGEVCLDGWCATPPETCGGPEHCLDQLVCDGFTHTCVDPTDEGCSSALDCAQAPGCEQGCDCSPMGACLQQGPGGTTTDPNDPPDDPDPAPPPRPPTPSIWAATCSRTARTPHRSTSR